jgi:hypothetical protein
MALNNSSADQPQALNFESDPPGAEIHTNQLQTCITPCSLTVPPQDQAVGVSKNGYVPQTVQVTTGPPPDHHFWEHPAPTLVPNPVHVVLQPVEKPKPSHHARSHKPASRTHAAEAAPPAPNSDPPPPPPTPPTQGPAAQSSAFPPPPPKQ